MYTLFLYLLLTNIVPTLYYKDGYWYIPPVKYECKFMMSIFYTMANNRILHEYIRKMCNNADTVIVINGTNEGVSLQWDEEDKVYC